MHFTNNGQSVFVRENAGAVDDLTNNRNTFVGSLSDQANTGGTQNVAVGYQALSNNITGSCNIAVGQQALQKIKTLITSLSDLMPPETTTMEIKILPLEILVDS